LNEKTCRVDGGGAYVSYDGQHGYRFSLGGKLVWHHTTCCEGGGGSTAVLHGGRATPGEPTTPSLILSPSTGVSSGPFASRTAPAFDGKDRYTLENGHLVAVDPTGSPTAGRLAMARSSPPRSSAAGPVRAAPVRVCRHPDSGSMSCGVSKLGYRC